MWVFVGTSWVCLEPSLDPGATADAPAAETAVTTLLNRTLRIGQAMIDIGGRFALGPTRTAHSRRAVNLPAFLVEELAGHLAASPVSDGLVFTAARGGPLRRTGVKGMSWSRVSDSNR